MSQLILEKISAGARRLKLEVEHPTCTRIIAQLMEHRPKRHGETHCIYIWGPPGCGKTTALKRILTTIEHLYPALTYYKKMSELSKFWDGYDNDPIVWIDDPGYFDMERHPEEAASFKNIISTGPHIVEIKYGKCQFDSRLCIITSNTAPEYFASSAGSCAEAISRRIGHDSLTGRAIYCPNLHATKTKLYRRVIKCVKAIAEQYYHINIDTDLVMDNLPPIVPLHVDISSSD